MNRPWKPFEEELRALGKSPMWLATRIGCSIQRVQNWKKRGIPKEAFPEVAKAFEDSIDWVAGLAPSKRLQEKGQAFDTDTLQFATGYQALDEGGRDVLRTMQRVLLKAKPSESGKVVTLPIPPSLPTLLRMTAEQKRRHRTNLAGPAKKKKGLPNVRSTHQ